MSLAHTNLVRESLGIAHYEGKRVLLYEDPSNPYELLIFSESGIVQPHEKSSAGGDTASGLFSYP